MTVPDSIRRLASRIRPEEPYATLYYYRLDDLDILFRLPTRKEISLFYLGVGIGEVDNPLAYDEEGLLAQEIFMQQVLYHPKPSGFDDKPFTLAFRFISVVVELSGLLSQDPTRLLEGLKVFRAATQQSYENALVIAICAAFPTIRPEDIDDWDLNRILRHAALSEALLGRKIFEGQGPPPAPRRGDVVMPQKSTSPPRPASAFAPTTQARSPQMAQQQPQHAPPSQPTRGYIDFSAENKALREFGLE